MNNANASPTVDGITPWPDEFAERYRAAGYWQGRSLASCIADQVGQRPDDIALVDGDVRLSYRQLWDKAASCAQFLLDRSIAPGDRILLQLPNCWEFVALTLACFRIGVVPIMATPAHRRRELAHVAALADAAAIVTAASDRQTDLRRIAHQVADEVTSVRSILLHGAEPAPPDAGAVAEYALADGMKTPVQVAIDDCEPAGGDLACMLLSGGTTGLPKLIARTHDDYACNVLQCGEVGGYDATTVYLVVIPASHNFPLGSPGFLAALFAGGRVVMLGSPAAEPALRTIDEEAVTITAVVPAVAHRWIEQQRRDRTMRGHSLKVLQVGGSRMPDELARQIESVLGARLQQVFGMAEGLINMTRLDDPMEAICNTQGRPVSEADEVRVVDASGEPVPDGSPGALLTRGPYTPRGYFRAPEQNARSFTPDGWYRSGDIVVRRPDGNLVVAGRDKDMINRGGEKISAEEIESIVYQLDAVDTAAAVAMPDPVLGERVCLYVSLKSGRELTLGDVVALMNQVGVAPFKIPERLLVVDAIPATKVGKIDKKALRDDIGGRMAREVADVRA